MPKDTTRTSREVRSLGGWFGWGTDAPAGPSHDSPHDPRPSPLPQISGSLLLYIPQTTVWRTLLTLDRESDDFTRLAKQLLSDKKNGEFGIRQFPDDEALEVVELIEPTILEHANIPEDLKTTAFAMLQELCGKYGRLPKSYLIEEDFEAQEGVAFATHGYTDLWKRDLNGRKFAVKALRFHPDDDSREATQRFCKEVLLWKRLNHPNVLAFHGASMKQHQLCIVSPWVDNGNVVSYTRNNPEANRLQLLIDVTSGLKFLHQMGLVHGDVRGSNVLISDDQPPQALLGDFGLNAILFDPFSLTAAPINWTAPELLSPDDTPPQPSSPIFWPDWLNRTAPEPVAPNDTHLKPSFASDMYSLAMVIYEVLSGTSPFSGREKIELAFKVVFEGERPSRPGDSEKLGFTDTVWEILQGCWEKDPPARPTIDAVSACLKQAAEAWVADVRVFTLASKAGVEQVMGIKRDQVMDFVNRLNETISQIGISQNPGKAYLKYLQRLCGELGVLPASFMLTDRLDHIEGPPPLMRGAFVDVYKAMHKGHPMVAKAFKITSAESLESLQKHLAKGIVAWRWLQHENVLPFIGITSIPPPISIVSPWMENGTIVGFMKAHPEQNPFSLLVDAANGLQYLHQQKLVHGDLRGANILINSNGRACLAGFGINRVVGASYAQVVGERMAEDTVEWMAPELLDPKRYGYIKGAQRKLPSMSTDIYALGMTIFEVVTGREPFKNTILHIGVVQEVLYGTRPKRPKVGFSDALWAFMTRMWSEEFESTLLTRPDITDVVERLLDEAKDWSPASGASGSSSSMSSVVSLERRSSGSSIGSFMSPNPPAKRARTPPTRNVTLPLSEVSRGADSPPQSRSRRQRTKRRIGKALDKLKNLSKGKGPAT